VPAALTPDLALSYLGELSTDIRGAVILGADGARAAGDDALAEPARQMLASSGGDAVEVTTRRGSVFAARMGAHAIAVVTGRFALPALVRYDVRRALADLEPAAA
jgi:predicted regulator of Ras-like GTPase activity (Roadblock/LC7/MglB family)